MKKTGFTIMELLVVVAIGSVVTLGVLLSIQQVLIGTGGNRSEVDVLSTVHNTALTIKRDLQAYQTANISDLQTGGSVTFYWYDQTGFTEEDERDHYSTYSLSENGTLFRTCDNVTGIAGRNIVDLDFTINGDYIDVVLVADSGTVPEYTENISFSVYKRAQEAEE